MILTKPPNHCGRRVRMKDNIVLWFKNTEPPISTMIFGWKLVTYCGVGQYLKVFPLNRVSADLPSRFGPRHLTHRRHRPGALRCTARSRQKTLDSWNTPTGLSAGFRGPGPSPRKRMENMGQPTTLAHPHTGAFGDEPRRPGWRFTWSPS